MFIAGLETGKSSQGREHTEKIGRKHQDLKKDLYKFLTNEKISLVDELCNEKEDQEQKSVLETLLSLNEGCEVITEQLNDLKTSESSKSPNVEVLYLLPSFQGILGGKGLLFQGWRQQKVQEVGILIKVPRPRCNFDRNRLSHRRVLCGRKKDPFGSLHAAL